MKRKFVDLSEKQNFLSAYENYKTEKQEIIVDYLKERSMETNLKLKELTEKFNKRLDVIINANPDENFVLENKEKSEEMLRAKLYKLRGNKHPLQNKAVAYLEQNILNLRVEEHNFEIQQGKSFNSLFISDTQKDNLLAIFEKLKERKEQNNLAVFFGLDKELKLKINVGDEFRFKNNNQTYEVFNIREDANPKIYLETYNEIGREEATFRQSNLEELIEKKEVTVEYLKENNIMKTADQILTDVKANFSAEEKAFFREVLLGELNQNVLSPIDFKKNSNISIEGLEKVSNFYDKFKKENYTPVSEQDLKDFGWNYANVYIDEKFQNKVNDVLKAMYDDKDIRTEINKVYSNIEDEKFNKLLTQALMSEIKTSFTPIEKGYLNTLISEKTEISTGFSTEDFEKHSMITEKEKENTRKWLDNIQKNNPKFDFENLLREMYKTDDFQKEITKVFTEITTNKFKENKMENNEEEKLEQEMKTYRLIEFINGGKVYSLSAEKGKKDITPTKEKLIEDFLNLTDYQKEFVREQGAKTAISLMEEVIDNTVSKETKENTFKNFEDFFKSVELYVNVNNEEEKLEQDINKIKKVEFLKNQMKYLGFGESEKLHQDLMKGINSEEAKFNIATTSDRVMTGNKVEFQLHFNKTDKGGIFLNSYEAKLTTKQGEERSHTFKVQKSNNVTAKEAINLLEGRAVKIEKTNINEETGEITNDSAFIKLKLREPKTDYNNYKFEMYSKNYGVDVENIMEKANLVFTNDTQRERVKQNLEKGNVTNVTFQHDKKVIEGFAVLNPQWKMLNLYDEKMNRVNSNKLTQTNELQDNQKNNVREQHISRRL